MQKDEPIAGDTKQLKELELDKHCSEPDEFVEALTLMATKKLAKNDPTLTELDLSNRDLSRLDEVAWKSFCEALASNKMLEKLTLKGASLPCLNEERWNLFCVAISTQKSIITLNLERCVNATIATHPSQVPKSIGGYKPAINCWSKFYSALAKNQSITNLNLAHNAGLSLHGHEFESSIYRNSTLRILNISYLDYSDVNYSGTLLEQTCTNIRGSNSIHRICGVPVLISGDPWDWLRAHPAPYPDLLISYTNTKISVKDRYPRHREAIAFAQGLYSKKLPKQVVNYILTFFDSKRLANKAVEELDEHLARHKGK